MNLRDQISRELSFVPLCLYPVQPCIRILRDSLGSPFVPGEVASSSRLADLGLKTLSSHPSVVLRSSCFLSHSYSVW